jgi:hypothetical protein
MGKAGDIIRKIVSFALLVAAGIALVGFFMSVGTVVFTPFKNAFSPTFDFAALGQALFGFMEALGIPLMMIILGIIGLTVND